MVFGLENGKNWVCFFKKGIVLTADFTDFTDLCIATEGTALGAPNGENTENLI